MKAQHTPGPWHVSDPESCNEVIDSMGRTIAEVEEWDSEKRGNVTLLAAAPDMLEMLHILWVRIPSHIMEQYGVAEEEVTAVLFKAKGE